jgi:hypothetical protein
MKTYREYVELFQDPQQHLESLRVLSGGSLQGRETRGKKLPPEIIQALIWGLDHQSPVVRRNCLEILDAHPDYSAIPHVIRKLEDPVPRVRWHAVHALICDVCKVGDSFVNDEVLTKLRSVAENDPSEKVRNYARWELQQAGAWPV